MNKQKYITKRKIISLVLTPVLCLTLGVPALAAPSIGDIIGNVLHSDIMAYIDGAPIQTSNIANKTMVIVEDLSNYGFGVTWNNDERTLGVEPNPNKPFNLSFVERDIAPSGTVKGKYFYTDIKTYLSSGVTESFNINGKTVIDFELLAKYGRIYWNAHERTLRLITYINIDEYIAANERIFPDGFIYSEESLLTEDFSDALSPKEAALIVIKYHLLYEESISDSFSIFKYRHIKLMKVIYLQPAKHQSPCYVFYILDKDGIPANGYAVGFDSTLYMDAGRGYLELYHYYP